MCTEPKFDHVFIHSFFFQLILLKSKHFLHYFGHLPLLLTAQQHLSMLLHIFFLAFNMYIFPSLHPSIHLSLYLYRSLSLDSNLLFLTRLLLLGWLYWLVQKRARPSSYRKILKGSQEVTST